MPLICERLVVLATLESMRFSGKFVFFHLGKKREQRNCQEKILHWSCPPPELRRTQLIPQQTTCRQLKGEPDKHKSLQLKELLLRELDKVTRDKERP